MHVISRKRLKGFWAIHPDAENSLEAWHRITRRALWTSFAEVRAVFPHADQVGTCVVFNIGGNKYRLIAHISYATRPVPGKPRFRGKLFILHVLTHEKYDTGQWKRDCGA